MLRLLKSTGLAFVAILAMGAVIASAASAAEFHSSGSPTHLEGEQAVQNEFTVPGAGTVVCQEANFVGDVEGTSIPSVTVHPEYGDCKAFGFANTDVNTNACEYEFGDVLGTGPFTGNVSIVNCGGSEIEITPKVLGLPVCTITVGEQEDIGGGVEFANQSGDILVTALTKESINHSGGCGASAGNDGTYTGSVLENGGEHSISVG